MKILVIGGGYAGVLVAQRVAAKATRAEVTLVSDEARFVERVRLAEYVGTGCDVTHDLRTRLPPSIRFIQARVSEIRENVVSCVGGAIIPFDICVLATGSETSHAPQGAYDIGNFSRAQRARERWLALPAGARVTVCGGGLTAIELASELAEARRDVHISLVTAGVLAAGLSTEGRTRLRAHFAHNGITIREHTLVTETLPDEMTIWAAGMRPAAPIAGVPTEPGGRACVDATLRARPNLFVIGDAAHSQVRMGCVAALPMAVYAADAVIAQMRGRTLAPFRFAFYAQCISLGRRSGLVQFVHSDDTPKKRVLSGRAAAMIKEAICRYAGQRPFADNEGWFAQRRHEEPVTA